eukprot:1160217-Pelagomonas_calceolata.AAC.21
MQICGHSRTFIGQGQYQHTRPLAHVLPGTQGRHPYIASSPSRLISEPSLAVLKKGVAREGAGTGICQALPKVSVDSFKQIVP